MNKKDVILFISIFCVLALISGATYAYWGWSSNTNKSVVFNTSKGIEDYIIYDEGDSHFVGNFQPSSNFCGGISTEISLGLNAEDMSETELNHYEKHRLLATINMDINSIGTALSSSSLLKWALIDGTNVNLGSVCDSTFNVLVAKGEFTGVSAGTTIELSAFIPVTASVKKYLVVIWLENTSDVYMVSGETIDVNIWTRIDESDTSVCRIHYMDMGTTNHDDTGYAFYQDITEGESFVVGEATGGHLPSGKPWTWIPEGDVYSCYYHGGNATANCGTIFYGSSAGCIG